MCVCVEGGGGGGEGRERGLKKLYFAHCILTIYLFSIYLLKWQQGQFRISRSLSKL